MQLVGKALRFVAEAVEHEIRDHERRLAAPGLSEDDQSDLTNDMLYLKAILADMKREIAPPAA